jgi:hypothetical protein
MIVGWGAIGACVAAMATVWVATTAKWVLTGEWIAIVRRIGIAIGIADGMKTEVIATTGAGTAATGIETTGVITRNSDPAIA